MQTLSQLKKNLEQQKADNESRVVNPWYRFPKGENGRIDKNGPSIQFRFLAELDDITLSRSHYDEVQNVAVQCNRQITLKKDGSIILTGNCYYCDKRKQYKADFKPTPQRSYADNKWDMNAVLVAPVAVLQQDGTQKFYLLPLKAKDYLYSVGKGFYGTLRNFSDMKAKAKKPSKLTDYWWELSPEFILMSGERCSEDELSVEVLGWLDENGDEYDIQKAAPKNYQETVNKLLGINSADNVEAEEFDDDNPPF
jgi:hypothetical protein